MTDQNRLFTTHGFKDHQIKLLLLGGLLAILAADVQTTTAILSIPGGVELNPLMVPFVVSPVLMVLAKLCCVCIVVSVGMLCQLTCKKNAMPIRGDYLIIGTATLTTCIPVVNNLFVLV